MAVSEGLPGAPFYRGRGGRRREIARAGVTAAMAEIRRDFGERVHERGGNGQEVRRRDQGALMRTSAHGREARFAAEMELNAANWRPPQLVRAEKKTWGRRRWRGHRILIRR